MAVDPVRAEETIAWLARADEDLRAARVLIDTREPLLETAYSIAGKQPRRRSRRFVKSRHIDAEWHRLGDTES